MQYVMVVRVDPELAGRTGIDDVEPWVEEGERRGLRLEGRPLEDPDTATTVLVRDGRVLLSDGPFAELKEVVVGYDLLEAPDLDTAVDYAARHPLAVAGALEVREVWTGFAPAASDAAPQVRSEGIDYLFLHVLDPRLLAAAGPESADPTAWVRDVEARRATAGGFRLRDADEATGATVRRRDGELLITRGPFAEVAEQITGIDRIRAADLDEALEIAAAHPTAPVGAIEVRPFGTL